MSASLTGATDFSWQVGNCFLVGCGGGCLCVVHIKCSYDRVVDRAQINTPDEPNEQYEQLNIFFQKRLRKFYYYIIYYII